MPVNPEWLHRVGEIRRQLEQLAVPVVDRSVIEGMFRVGRRRAIQLMHSFGGYLAGKTFLVDRVQLMSKLDTLQRSGEFAVEEGRRERLGVGIEKLRQAHVGSFVRIPVTAEILSTKVSRLPPGIALTPGRLVIEFDGTEELLVRLVELSQAAVNDFECFTAAATRTTP